VDVSSTDVRRLVRDGRDVSTLVPPGVLEIIEREGLYA
jgi:nicotinic acid mononucleotide adenylyltransferase